MKKIILSLSFALIAKISFSQVIPAASLGPDLMGEIKVCQWESHPYEDSVPEYDLVNKGFPITTDSEGNSNHYEWQNSIGCKVSVNLKANHAYQFVLKMKADTFPRGQNIIIILKDQKQDNRYRSQIAWNVSKADTWEKVYFTIFPTIDGPWEVQHVFVEPLLMYKSTPSTIYISPDIDVYELPAGTEAANIDNIDLNTDKDAFENSNIRIDVLGNVYTHQADNSWKHVFPKLIYKGYNGGVTTDTIYAKYARYKDYGFNGVMDVWTGQEAQAVIDVGMEHISINANFNNTEDMEYYVNSVNEWADKNNKHDNILWYNYDNENDQIPRYEFNEALMSYINTHFVDPVTNKRRQPVYFLNGNFGLARCYHRNDSTSVMDITGSYVGNLDAIAAASILPAQPTLLTEFLTENQRAPVVVIQLQSFLNNYFIPSLFHGIIMGGKALSVWRDGDDWQNLHKKSYNFANYSWAAPFRDDVAPKLDSMLPLIKQPHITTWKAYTNQFPNVRIGTRDYDNSGYLILTNYGDTDLQVTVNLVDKNATEAVDMFTGELIANISNNSFQFTLGHHNQGYRVIKLKDTSSNDTTDDTDIEPVPVITPKILPNPATDRITIEPGSPDLQIDIFNIRGRRVLHGKRGSNTFNIINLPKGIYYVHCRYAEKTEILKLIKQ